MTSQHNTGTHPFYIGMYIHICTHIYVHIYTSQKECLCIFSHVQSYSARSVDEINPYLVRPMEIITAKTKCSRYFVPQCECFFPLRASSATGTQDLSIFEECSNSVQIRFHLGCVQKAFANL